MNLKVGIIGLANVGKSTLFNALLKKRAALSANYPFATIEPNVGVVAVPDDRLQKLAELVKTEVKMDHLPPIVPAVVEFVDIAGLVKGAHKGEGLGNQFLSHIREVDAIIHVVRDFEDPNVIRAGSTNPDEDKKTIETELALSDLQTLEKLIHNRQKEVRVNKDPIESDKLIILNKLKDELDQGKSVGNFKISNLNLKSWFAHLPLLSLKPVLYVYNVQENEYEKRFADVPENENSLVICAKLEEELADLQEEERKNYLKELGVSSSGLERLSQKAYKLLDLISYLTAGEKEVRAWTIEKGTSAQKAAGVIHTDFEKKFIKAEIIPWNKLIESGGWMSAKEKGFVKIAGKDEIINDGDVVEFKI